MTAWDVSTARYLQRFYLGTEESFPDCIFFKPDGTKMYTIGISDDEVKEYDLGTAWDVTTAVYLQLFSVGTEETTPNAIFFKPDGKKMYVVGSTGDDVNEYDLGTAWNVSTASYLQNFSLAGQDIFPTGIFFKPDGKRMYVTGDIGNDVNEYYLSTAWNVSTASFQRLFSVAGQEDSPNGIFIKPDGLKMYIAGGAGNAVYEYDLGTAWNVTTAVYLQNLSVAGQETEPTGIFFRPDGFKMYVVGSSGKYVNEYNLFFSIYTTAAIVKKRCKYISAALTDPDITQFINEAENLIDCVMRDSFLTDFDASNNAILRQCATDIAAYAATSYDPEAHSSPESFEATIETLWVEAERMLAYLEDKRTVDYLKSRVGDAAKDVSVVYTTAALVKKRCTYISSDLVDGDIEKFIEGAENLIDCVMRDSFVTEFDASHNAILRQCATGLAAFAATSYDPDLHPSPTMFGAMLDNLWVEAERLLAYLEDKRTVDYLKSRG